jgi:hypothetical protein
MSPVSNWLPVAVNVWATESLFVTLTVEPAATDTLIGENMKFAMVMELVAVAAPDPLDVVVPDPDELPPPLLQAARSSAAPRTRTTAPPLNRRAGSRTAQTACDVGLNANGVPEEVCEPGYMPST